MSVSEISATSGRSGHFGAIGFQKLQSRRRGVKKIVHCNARSRPAERRRSRAVHDPAMNGETRALPASRTRNDIETRHRADRRQRLAAKAKSRDIHQIDVAFVVGRQL